MPGSACNVSNDLSNNPLVIDRLGTNNVLAHRHTVTFQTGLYGSLDDMTQVIKHSMHSDPNFSDLEINLIGVAATQKVHVEVINGHTDSVKLAFSADNSIGSLLGFTSDKFFIANATSQAQSDTTASLDRTTSVLIQTSLCNGSIVAGKSGQSTVAMVHLAAYQPASVVAYTPQNMLEIPANNLSGMSVTNATFALVNQNSEDLNTLNENWQLVFEIVW